MPDPHQLYCRGCKCTVDESEFQDEDQQYKQCYRCRARLHHRARSNKTVVCQCGRRVLETSLRDHRKTLYHEQQMARLVDDKQHLPVDVNKLPQPAPPNATLRQAAIDHSKPGMVGPAQRAAAVPGQPAIAKTAAAAADQGKPAAAGQGKPAISKAAAAAADQGNPAAAAGQAKATVKPAAADQGKPAAADQSKPAAAGQAKSVATGRAEPPVIPAKASMQALRPLVIKAPAAPVSSDSFAMLKQLQSRS
jgi:hypothetical protein